MPRIFINYRRDDSEDPAGRLYDVLRDHFSQDQLLSDSDMLEIGMDFVEALDKARWPFSQRLVHK